jgi:aldehyde:ferredoxin oxidoreductase
MYGLLRVDMDGGSCVREAIPAQCAGMGGRALVSSLLERALPSGRPACDPRDTLVFAPGLLGATRAFARSRLAVGCKSPVSGQPRRASVSCSAAAYLLRLGILGIIIDKAAPPGAWRQLEIRRDGARLAPSPAAGLGVAAAMSRLRGIHGPSFACIIVGPAGELRLPAANIAFTAPDGAGFRHAGRGGMGAIMGAKGLKSILVFPPDNEFPPLVDADAHARAAAGLDAALSRLAAGLRGNAGRDGAPPPEPDENARRVRAGGDCCPHACGLCGPSAANRRKTHDPKNAAGDSLWDAFPEAADTDLRARFTALCDDYGLDAFAVGAAVAACMAEGLWRPGDGAALMEAVGRIGTDSPLGRMLNGAPHARPSAGKNAGRAATPHQRKSAGGGADQAAAFADAMGICVFAARPILGSEQAVTALVRTLNAAHGWNLPPDYAFSLGKRILEIEEAFTSRS